MVGRGQPQGQPGANPLLSAKVDLLQGEHAAVEVGVRHPPAASGEEQLVALVEQVIAGAQTRAGLPLHIARICYVLGDSASQDLYRRAAVYVDKILKGTKPADLPVGRPTKFDLSVNLGTAKNLGLTIPPSIVHRADNVFK